MSTWHTIEITGVKAAGITLESLPSSSEEWGLSEGEPWAPSLTYVTSEDGKPGSFVEDEDSFNTNGRTKYSVEEVGAWARDITSGLADVVVTHDEQWDDDDGGRSVTVYRNGDIDRAASRVSALVPMDYLAIMNEGQRAIAALEATAEGDSNDAEIEAGQAVADVLRRLIEGIES